MCRSLLSSPFMPAPITYSGLERREQLLRLVESQQRVTITQICQEFVVSQATARRDLEVLEQEGKVQRFHGGALLILSAPPEPSFAERSGEQSDEKRRIGRAAAALVSDGETLFLGSGTTVLEVARNLRK